MRIERADPTAGKGWYVGPWNSDLAVSVGYANEEIDEPHVHQRITEIYMVARGYPLNKLGGYGSRNLFRCCGNEF